VLLCLPHQLLLQKILFSSHAWGYGNYKSIRSFLTEVKQWNETQWEVQNEKEEKHLWNFIYIMNILSGLISPLIRISCVESYYYTLFCNWSYIMLLTFIYLWLALSCWDVTSTELYPKFYCSCTPHVPFLILCSFGKHFPIFLWFKYFSVKLWLLLQEQFNHKRNAVLESITERK